ncbi:MAG: glycosyltransferase family 2 protein, partial [Anaerolineales bacterium]
MNLEVSVVICAYTEKRWDDLVAAVASLQNQTVTPAEIIVVIDHNPQLYRRALEKLDGVIVLENQQEHGLSGARNTGIATAQGAVIAFMDEDALATPDWLECLLMGFQNHQVLGVGGAIEPMWLVGKPGWFPEEFNWVVGCTYQGMPKHAAPVRNLIGCNMSFRREIFDSHDGFRHGIGRIGTRPLGCEETELCIRVGQANPESWFLYEPQAVVNHRVPAERTDFRYYLSRCYSEGLSKAQISLLVGSDDGLASERTHALRTLPLGVLQGFKDAFLRKNLDGVLRAGAIVIGLAFTTTGYLVGNLFIRYGKNPRDSEAWLEEPQENRLMSTATHPSNFKPVKLIDVEISQPIPDLPIEVTEGGDKYHRAKSLVRLHSQPLGIVDLRLNKSGLASADYASQIWDAMAVEI